jgi:CRISPR-associated protein Csm3
MSKLEKKIKISTTLEILTGIHIGGSKENVEIGGIDTPVIKIATKNNQPYIPGSSLKGKLRSLLEQIEGVTEVGGGTKQAFEEKKESVKDIINLFGFANDKKPSKLIVRDAYLSESSVRKLEENENLDMPYTENKFENTIDRFSGVTKRGGLRQIERIPAGVTFDVEFVINIWSEDEEEKLIELLEKGIKALENDYLGGSGSRGYGQVKFGELKKEEVSFENYLESK